MVFANATPLSLGPLFASRVLDPVFDENGNRVSYRAAGEGVVLLADSCFNARLAHLSLSPSEGRELRIQRLKVHDGVMGSSEDEP